MKVKIGMVQFPIEEGRSEKEFYQKCNFYFSEAQKQAVDMLVFPELACLDIVDFKADLPKQWQYLTETFTPQYFDYIRKRSQEVNLTVLTGSAPILENGKTLNRAILFENGEPLVVQDKVYMTPEEELVWKWTSTAKLNVFEWKGIKSTILICHDSEFADISHTLSSNDVELFIVPSMTSDIWGLNRVRWCSKARAVEHHSYVLITGTVDSKKDQNSYVGQAALVTPQNPNFPPDIALGPFNIAALVAFEIDMELLRKSRSERTLVNPRRDLQARKDSLFIHKK